MNTDGWKDDDESPNPERYLFNEVDQRIVSSAVLLLEKIVRSSLITPAQLISVAKNLHVLTSLPQVSSEIIVSVCLSGPRRIFGEHEIHHYWNVDIERTRIDVYSGGYFYRESTGGDSFTLLQWTALPGTEADSNDYLALHWIVDDARPFDRDVEEIDLSEIGYSLEVHDEDNSFLEG